MQTDVEVLKTEVGSLRADMAGLNAKMDIVLSMQVQMVQLQERQDTTNKALDRAFDSIRDTRERLQTMESVYHRTWGIARGFFLVGALLMSFTVWYFQEQLATLKKHAVDLQVVDRRMERIEGKLWPDIAGEPK